MKESYTSRGKGYNEIVHDATTMLELALTLDPSTDKGVLTRDSIATILGQVDDVEHFREPLATALLDFVLSRDARIIVSHHDATNEHSAQTSPT
jgi:hypothetical protein